MEQQSAAHPLEAHVSKLRESNAQLRAALDEKFDPQLQQALGENIVAIAKACAQLEKLHQTPTPVPETDAPGVFL